MKRRKEAVFLFLSAIIPLAFAIYTWKRDVSQRYIYFIKPFLIILSAVGIYGIISLATEKIKNSKIKLLSILFLLALSLFTLDLEDVFSKDSKIYNQDNYYPAFAPVLDYIIENRKPDDAIITRAYRSFYWKGENFEVLDTKKYVKGRSGCSKIIESFAEDNPSGWVVFPSVDRITVCSDGRKYYKEEFDQIKDESFPSSIKVYRWDKEN